MKRVHSLVLLAVISGALAVGTTFAQERGAGGERRGHPRPGGITRDGGLPLGRLDLSEAQQQQIRTLTQQHREQNQEVVAKLRAAIDAQRRTTEATPVDEPAIRAAVQGAADVQAELAVRQARLRAEVFALLTPEQQAQAEKLRAERGARQSEIRERRSEMRERRQQRGA
jgi:periplasmic protein CpxP/Spy